MIFVVVFNLRFLLIFVLGAFLWPPLTVQAKKTMRVMTYNIHVGVGMDKKLDLQRIADGPPNV